MVRDHLFEKSKTIEDNLSELILDGNQIEGKMFISTMTVRNINITLKIEQKMKKKKKLLNHKIR